MNGELVGSIMLGLLILLGMGIIAVIGTVIAGGFKKKWYKVYLANDDVVLVYKKWTDRFWQADRATTALFRYENGKAVRISVHWILKIEEQ